MRQMTPELAALSRSIDTAVLGQRIRSARVAAGMTQAQVASDDVTTAYISRIEDGQRRPDAQLLERMAGRMNSTLDELVLGVTRNEAIELQVALDHAELELASGNAKAALTGADNVLKAVGDKGVVDLQRSARELRAYALEAIGELDDAILALEDIVQTPKPDARWLKALIALSRCYRDSGDLSRAIAVGEQAEHTIEELGIAGLTEAIQLTVTVAAAYTTKGDAGHALRMCQRALAAAEKYDSPIGKASAYWEASMLEAGKGAHESALALARKAIAILELGEDARNVARLRAEIANMQLKQDPPDAAGALDTLTQVDKEMSWSAATKYDVARTHLTRGRAHFLLGDYAKALQYATDSVNRAPEDAPLMRAATSVLQGQVAAAEGRVPDARQFYLEAVQTLTGIGADREAAQLWFDLGGLLAEVGETDGALDAFRRAAASTGLTSASVIRTSADIND
jgi:tetratricopeptide (TPR) repeat protein